MTQPEPQRLPACQENMILSLRDFFRSLLHRLCENAPRVAATIVETIQEHNKTQGRRKRKRTGDPSYRPSKAARHNAKSFPSAASAAESNSSRTPTSKEKGEKSGADDCQPPQPPPGAERNSSHTPISKEKGEKSSADDCQAPQPLSEYPSTQPLQSENNTANQIATSQAPPSGILPKLSATTQTEEQLAQPPLLGPCVKAITLAQAIDILQRLSRYRDGTPRAVHIRILQSLNESKNTAAATSSRWSDGSMWKLILDSGMSHNRRSTIFNLLELMGASIWYDRKVEEAQPNTLTKKNTPAARRGAAVRVLDQIQEQLNKHAQPINQDEGEPAKCQGGDIKEQLLASQRKNLLNNFNRGRNLRKLEEEEEVGIGILFSPHVWKYIKLGHALLSSTIDAIKKDKKQKKLLQILGTQVRHLVNTGSPDLHAFYTEIRAAGLLSESDHCWLQTHAALDHDPLPIGELDAALERLKKCIAEKVFRKPFLHPNDTVKIYSFEFSSEIFRHLRRGQFNSWTIAAAMHISDKPSHVKYYDSVTLDEGDKPKPSPFSGLAAKIAANRREMGEGTSLVHFCPVHDDTIKHFTLLEINDEDRIIRHYNSLSENNIIKGKNKETRASRLVAEEFGSLNYQYYEEPTPQQTDGWSCGVRVAWNFKRLANGFPIGSWKTKLNPDRMKLEIVEGLLACAESGIMRQNRCEGKILPKKA